MIARAAVEKRTDGASGTVFDSAGELRRWRELVLLERSGEISGLRRQVKYPLRIGDRSLLIRSDGYPNGRQCSYTADFVYREDDQEIVEDWKPMATDAARLRIAIFEAIYRVRVRLTGGGKYRTYKKARSA